MLGQIWGKFLNKVDCDDLIEIKHDPLYTS